MPTLLLTLGRMACLLPAWKISDKLSAFIAKKKMVYHSAIIYKIIGWEKPNMSYEAFFQQRASIENSFSLTLCLQCGPGLHTSCHLIVRIFVVFAAMQFVFRLDIVCGKAVSQLQLESYTYPKNNGKAMLFFIHFFTEKENKT